MVKEAVIISSHTLESNFQSEEPEILVPKGFAENSPCANVIGAFVNDPVFDAMLENIHARRIEIDADDAIE